MADAAPLTVGVRPPVIVLPRALADAPGSVLVSVLRHEMAHARRADFAWNLLAEVATAPVAFHPALWLLKRRLAAARETACDEAACASGLDRGRCNLAVIRVGHP